MPAPLSTIEPGTYDLCIEGDAPLHVMHFGALTITREKARVVLDEQAAADVRAACSRLHAARRADGRRWELKASGDAEGAASYASFVSVCPVAPRIDDSAPATAVESSNGPSGTTSPALPRADEPKRATPKKRGLFRSKGN